jgi:hypothetical protein
MKLLLACLLSLPAFSFAQEAAWDNTPHAANLVAQAAKLKPLLDQLTPQEWIAQGASPTYVSQLERARQDLAGLAASAASLDRQPTRLTLALDTYFRLQGFEWEIESVIDAVRRYQGNAAADQLLSTLRSNSANRDGLREFITDLAARRESEFSIVDQEAQRCAAELSKIPTATTPRRNNTKK